MRVLSCYPLLGRVHFYLKQPKSNKIKPDNLDGQKSLVNHYSKKKLNKKNVKMSQTLHLKLGFKNHIHANHPTSKHCSQRIRSSTYTPNYPHIHITG